jgi:4-oxalocrotonate tautomerase
MLIVRVTMLEGRTDEQKAELLRRVSETAARHFGVPLEQVRMVIDELPKANWGIGGVSMEARESANSRKS